jgi:uncharacterized phage-associated protein
VVHPTYIRSLRDDTLRSVLQIFWTRYGETKQDELEANTKRMMQPWNPPTPIEEMFTQLEELSYVVIHRIQTLTETLPRLVSGG